MLSDGQMTQIMVKGIQDGITLFFQIGLPVVLPPIIFAILLGLLVRFIERLIDKIFKHKR